MIFSTISLLVVATLALAAGVASITLVYGKPMLWLRDWAHKHNPTFLGAMLECSYCTSHWVAFVFVAAYRPRIIELFYPLDLLVSALVMVALATPVMALIKHAWTFKPDSAWHQQRDARMVQGNGKVHQPTQPQYPILGSEAETIGIVRRIPTVRKRS
jgi:hypothetical protein